MKNQELIGIWESTDYVFDNGPDRRCVVATIRLPDKSIQTIRGYIAEGVTAEGVTYRFFGHYRNHPKYGRQFNFNSLVEETPVDEDSVIAYLQQCRGPERGSITRRVAIALFEAFGIEAIDRLIDDPVGCSQSIKQWDAAKAGIAAGYLASMRGTQRCKLDLITLLNGRGFPKKTVDRAIKEWGAAASRVVREDPFELTCLPGIGFRSADKLYCDLAREQSKTDTEYQERLAALKRQGLCAAYILSSDMSGSTWLPTNLVKARISQHISATRARPDEAIEWAVMHGYIVVDGNHCANARRARHELEIAEFVATINNEKDWPTYDYIEHFAPEDKPLSEHQSTAILQATSGRIGCLQGSPGVGKTFAVACIVRAVVDMFGRDSICVCAPTGKAAVRVTQSLAANGLEMQAGTIHRVLQVEGEGSDGWSFHFNDQNPLPYRFIVIDEASMIDVDLMAALFRACTITTHILLVGDVNQLAPVGHGKPFCDLQQCVPTGHLTEIRRNSGRIVQSCAEIRDQQKISFSAKVEGEENLGLVECNDDDQVVSLENLIKRYQASPLDVVEDLQVLTAKNDASPVARKPLNQMLQKMLNRGEPVKGNPFRLGDKVVCLKNGIYSDPGDRDTQHFVANGELGRVTLIEPGKMHIRLSEPARTVAVFHSAVAENEKEVADSIESKGAVGDWDLGYCLSCHKSQGSQWKIVIVMADSKGGFVQSRNWIYTAISRAESVTYVIGQRRVVNDMMRRDGINDRKTLLVERIELERTARVIDHDALWEVVV